MKEQRELSSILSRNEKKENDRQPDYRGVRHNSRRRLCDQRLKEEGEDGPFLSLAFSKKEPTQRRVISDAKVDDGIAF